MRRGTTPTHVFLTSIDLSDAAVIYITYRQGNKKVLEKTGEDLIVTTEQVTTKLTQEETLLFSVNDPVKIQIRAKFADQSAIASNVITTTADVILKEGVI